MEVVFVATDDQTEDEDSVDEQLISGSTISCGNYPFYDSRVIDSKPEETNHYCDNSNQAVNESECLSLSDSASQANGEATALSGNSVSSSPTKRYPGVARLSLRACQTCPTADGLLVNQNCETNSKIETLIE